MRILNNNARMACSHELGKVANVPSQTWVTIAKSPVLVAPDPIGKVLAGCPNVAPGILPCTATVTQSSGKSSFINIGGHPVCLDTTSGFTNGTPPGTVTYNVKSPGQHFVSTNA